MNEPHDWQEDQFKSYLPYIPYICESKEKLYLYTKRQFSQDTIETMSYSASTHRVRSPYTSPSIGPDLMCILDEDDDEDTIDTVK